MPSTLQLPHAPAPLKPDSAERAPGPVRVGFVSLGCPKNLIDSEVMMGMLQAGGAELTRDSGDADVLVVNTCSFIDAAKQESVNAILEMAALKRGGRARKLVVAGCLVERYRDEIRRSIPEVDAVVGTGELDGILRAAGLNPPAAPSPFRILTGSAMDVRPAAETVLASEAGSSRAEGDLRERQGRFARDTWEGAAPALPTYLYSDETPRLLATGRASAYIKIAEGCDHPCTFCVIPNLRGKFRSRRVESVVAEAERLVASGVRELTLIGQDTTCYGEDFGLRDGLALLLERLAAIDGLVWLRFLYTYPNRITGRLLSVMAGNPKICPYLDIPLQHASPGTLRRMRRGGGASIFLKTLEKARAAVPGLVVRTGFIAGFPGETDSEFAELKEFVREARFDWMGVFAYSDEEGAKAFEFGEKVPRRTAEARRRSLMKLQQGISRERKQSWVGRTVQVLVEGPSEETPLLWEGRSAFHAPEIDGKLYLNDFGPHETLVPGTFHRCEITEAHDYDVVARVL